MTPESSQPRRFTQDPLATQFPKEETIFPAAEQKSSFPIPTAQAIDAELPKLMDHLDEYPFAKKQQAQLGDMQLVYGTWGERRNNSWLRSAAQRMGLLTPQVRETLKNAGFTDGYYYSQDTDMSSPTFQALQALHGARLAKTVADARGWTHIHTLVLGSVSSVADTPKRVAKILNDWGIRVDTVQFYGQACNGAVAAIVDLTRLAEQGERMGPSIVVGLESLSGRQANPKDIKLSRTFGNGGGAIGFIPGKEIEHITGRTIFAKDTEGVIKIHPIYTLPEEGKKPLYPWYEVREGSEDAIVQTDEGIFVRMVEPDGPYAQMNGFDTFKFFSRYMPTLVVGVILDYVKEGSLYGKLNSWVAAHQPAKPVNTGLTKITNRLLDKIRTTGEFANEKVPEIVLHHLPKRISIPWLMQKAGVNNISAGTFLVHATEMVNRGHIKLNRPTLLIGYGIGSVMQANVVVFR